jgi:hypothetical protein
MELELEIPLIPGEKRINNPLDLLPDNSLDLLDRYMEPVDQQRPEPLLVGAGLLNLESLSKTLLINDPALEQLFAKIISDTAGRGADNLTEAKNDNTLPPSALQGQNSRLPAKTDDLKYFAQSQICQITYQTHVNTPIVQIAISYLTDMIW